ncbi:MAG TPA: 6-carboxytetrahydropterin synthase, partial [Ignavibacteriaceae bacterium]|nr:6-carboxytetrahydropterin synthase [Ignavibacteriaceae bacterium]
MLYVTRRETFSAAHRLFNPSYSDEKNLEIFGKCSNPEWHGHNYVLEVTVAGEPHAKTGFVIDLKILKNIISEHILEKTDHKNLNTET